MASRLPVEVVTHILTFLNVADRKDASLVCKQWHEASLDPILQKQTLVTFFAATTRTEPIAGLARRKTPHLVLSDLDGSLKAKELVLQTCHYLGEHLQSLSLKGSDITEKTFISFISQCPNLTSLNLSSCNCLFMSGKLLDNADDVANLQETLKNITNLNLSGIRYLSDATFNRMVSVCKNVEKIAIASCQVVFNSGAYYPISGTRRASTAVLTFDNILTFINKQATKLKGLNLSRTSIGDGSLVELAEVPDLQIEELSLVSCKEISDVGVAEFCKKQANVKVLDLAFCTDLTDASAIAASKYLKKIESLSFESCRHVTNKSVAGFHAMHNIKSVNLSACHQLTALGLIEGICSSTLPNLTSVNLNCCSGISDKLVVSLCKFLPQLLTLDLGSCFHLTNISVQAMSSTLRKLQSFRIAFNKELTDLGIVGLVDTVPLEDLHHEPHHSNCRCSRLYSNVPVFSKPLIYIEEKPKKVSVDEMNERMKQSDKPVYSLSNIKTLRSLDMKACSRLTDAGIVHAINFPELQHLDLSLCHELTDESIIAIASNNPSIESLSIAQCRQITDNALIAVGKKLPRLAALNISSCDLVTDRGLWGLLECQRLKQLDVSMCGGITVGCVEMLEQKLPLVQTVLKRYV